MRHDDLDYENDNDNDNDNDLSDARGYHLSALPAAALARSTCDLCPATTRSHSMRRRAVYAAFVLALNLLTPAGAADPPPPEEAPAVTAARAALERREHPRALDLLQERLRQEPGDQGARRLLVRTYLDLGQGPAAEQALEPLRGPGAAAGGAPVLAPADLAALGQALLLQGQFLRLIGSIDPGAAKGKDPRPRAELSALVGEAHLNLGEFKAARVRLAEARTLDPANTRALYGLARLALADKDQAGAAALVEQALALTPADPKGLELKGDLAYLAGERETAEEAFGQAITHSPSPGATLYYKRATVRIELNALPGAAADLAAARAQAPDLHWLDLAEGTLALRRDDPQAAVPYLESFLKSAPSNPQGIYLASLALAHTGRHAEALRRLQPLLEDKEKTAAVAMLQADILLAQGQAREAEEALLPFTATAHPPEMDQLIYRALAAQGRQAEAREVLGELAQQTPEQPAAVLTLARDLAGGGDRAGARAQLERLLAAAPGNLEAGLTLAQLELLEGAGAAALSRAQALAQAQPRDARVQTVLANALAVTGDLSGARAAAERALALAPRAAGAALTLARLALQAGDLKAARAPLEALLRANAKDSSALILLAALDAQDGKPEAATARLRQGLAAAPQDLQVRLALTRLLVERRDPAAALAVLAAAPEEQLAGAPLLRARGLVELAAQRPAAAQETFARLTTLLPKSADPLYLTVLARGARGGPGAPDAMAEALAQALSLDPALPLTAAAIRVAFAAQPNDAARTLLASRLTKVAPQVPALALEQARLASARGDGQAVLEFSRAAAAQAPADPAYRRTLIQALVGAGEAGPARASADEWLAAHPHDLETRALLAQIALGQGDTAAAAEHYRVILQDQPSNLLAQNNLAMLLLPTDPKAALPLAEAAHAARPDQADFADTLGAVLLALNEPGRALPVLEKAARGDQVNPSLSYHLAAALAATGARERARDLLKDLAGRDFPERDAAAALLMRLQTRP